jgi:Fe-S cluster assembly protein SufD
MNTTPESLRSAAAERAAQLGLPSRTLEDWRQVDVKPLAEVAFTGVIAGCPDATLPLATGEALEREAERLAAEIEAPACWSWAGDTRQLTVRGSGNRLRLNHHLTGGLGAWRLLLDVAPGATLDLELDHRIAAGACASIGIVARLGAGAVVRVAEHAGTPVGRLLVHADLTLDRDANLTWTSASRGGELLRHRCVAHLIGTHAQVDLAAIDVADGTRQAHRLVRVHHHVGPSTSHQLFKTVLHDKALASFDGLIAIDKGADGSAAEQMCRHLVLSPGAHADARPQLDVRADEVTAGHGATIGPLGEDEVMYLRMRGLPIETATRLLTTGFVHEVADRMAWAFAPQAFLGDV